MDMNIQSIPNHPPHLYLDFFNARHNAFFFSSLIPYAMPKIVSACIHTNFPGIPFMISLCAQDTVTYCTMIINDFLYVQGEIISTFSRRVQLDGYMVIS